MLNIYPASAIPKHIYTKCSNDMLSWLPLHWTSTIHSSLMVSTDNKVFFLNESLAKYCFTTTYTNYSTCKILFHYSIYQSFLWQTLYQLLFLSQTLHSAKYSSNTYTKHSNGRYFTSTQKLYSASTVTKHTASTLMIHFYFTLGSSVNNYNSSLMRSTDNKVCHLAW